MPTAKEVAEQLKGGWSMEDQVEELRGKYHLKKKDCDAYRESSETEIREIERAIGKLRQENLNKRTLVAQHENGDERVIKTVFRSDHKERLSLQRLTATMAIEEVDQTVCEAAKFLNNLRYEREERESRLNELRQEEERYTKHLSMKGGEQIETDATLTLLENQLDKARIKYDTARIITRRYHEILDTLKEDSLAMPAKLDSMEAALIHQVHELHSLKKTSKSALEARDTTKKELTTVEQQAYEARKQREMELSATKKEVDMRKNEADKVERRHVRATLISDNQDLKAQQELQQKLERQQKILTYEDAYRRIKETTHVTDMEDVVHRVIHQDSKQSHLKKQVGELESTRQRLKSELSTLLQQFHDMKYSGEQKESHSQRLLAGVKEDLDKEQIHNQKICERVDTNNKLLLDLTAGITAILNKLDEVKLRPPEHNYTRGNVYEELDIASKKLDHLLKELNIMPDTSVEDKMKLECPGFQDFLESQLPADNIRIRLNKQDSRLSTLSEFAFDGQEQEQFLNRSDIKRNGTKLIESKTKGNKKKKSKK